LCCGDEAKIFRTNNNKLIALLAKDEGNLTLDIQEKDNIETAELIADLDYNPSETKVWLTITMSVSPCVCVFPFL
jgi:hypothetical protein